MQVELQLATLVPALAAGTFKPLQEKAHAQARLALAAAPEVAAVPAARPLREALPPQARMESRQAEAEQRAALREPRQA